MEETSRIEEIEEVDAPLPGSVIDTPYPVYSYETKGGKQINVKHDTMGSFWHVEFAPGGQVPASLAGKYTSSGLAQHDVEQYLAKQG